MKLNGIVVDDEFLISELSEWEGKISELAYKIAKRYDMLTNDSQRDYMRIENIRKVLSKLKKNLLENRSEVLKSLCKAGDELGVSNVQPVFEGKKVGFTEEVRAFTARNFPDFEEQVKKICKPLPLITFVFGDKHHPFSHHQYLDFWLEKKHKYTKRADYEFGIGKYNLRYISIGDIIDGQSIKYHEINPNLSSASDELLEAKIHLSEWYKEFPDVWVMEGNHDALYRRKILSSGLPKDCLKPLNELLGVPNWKFADEFIDTQYNILFTHGTKLSKTSIKIKALKENLSVVCGHHHSLMSIEYITQGKFVAFTGCGINFSSSAFDYARGGANTPLLGGIVIYDGQPILEVMKEI